MRMGTKFFIPPPHLTWLLHWATYLISTYFTTMRRAPVLEITVKDNVQELGLLISLCYADVENQSKKKKKTYQMEQNSHKISEVMKNITVVHWTRMA